jgi:hypothetical protein
MYAEIVALQAAIKRTRASANSAEVSRVDLSHPEMVALQAAIKRTRANPTLSEVSQDGYILMNKKDEVSALLSVQRW